MSRPSYDVEALRSRGRELAAAAPPLTPEQRERIRAILRGCAPAPDMDVGGPPRPPTKSTTAEPPPSNGSTSDAERTTAA